MAGDIGLTKYVGSGIYQFLSLAFRIIKQGMRREKIHSFLRRALLMNTQSRHYAKVVDYLHNNWILSGVHTTQERYIDDLHDIAVDVFRISNEAYYVGTWVMLQ